VIVGHGEPPVVEIPPQRGFLPDGVAKGGRDEPARIFHARVLLGDPGKEVIEEGSRRELSPRVALRRRKRRPLSLELEELVHAEERLARRGVLCDDGRLHTFLRAWLQLAPGQAWEGRTTM
jgi:hypothetical protein